MSEPQTTPPQTEDDARLAEAWRKVARLEAEIAELRRAAGLNPEWLAHEP